MEALFLPAQSQNFSQAETNHQQHQQPQFGPYLVLEHPLAQITPKSISTKPNPTQIRVEPTEFKFTNFKTPKIFEIISKGGKDSNPIPPRDAGITAVDTRRAEAAGDDAMRGRFEVGARVVVELRLLVENLLPEDAIGPGEKLGFLNDLGF